MSVNEDVAGAQVVAEDSICSGNSKLRLTDAVEHFQTLLKENDLIFSKCSSSISNEAMLMGEEIYNFTIEMLAEKTIVFDDTLIHENEICEEVFFEPVEEDHSSDEYEPREKQKRKTEHIPLDYKIKAVNIAKKHPNWSLETLKKNGCRRLQKKEYLSKWEEDIKKGGNTFDKYAIIDSWTYDRFVEARQNYQQVTTKNLQQWALSAARQFRNFEFKASERWVKKFKNQHRIRQRKITKYVSQKEAASMEEILKSAEVFRIQTLQLIPKFDKKFIINTDQTGMLM